MRESMVPTRRVLLTTAMQTVYEVPATGVDSAVVMNMHASNTGGASAPANLTMLVGGLKFYDAFPIGNTLDRDTYLILGPGDKIEALANANNAINLFVTLTERLTDG